MVDFSGKDITLMGLGVLGRGVNVAKFLLNRGAKLVITDLKTENELQNSIAELKGFNDQITYVLERHRIKDFTEADIVVKAAGVSVDNKYIQAARDAGIKVKMDASWFCELLPRSVKTIGVTGTKGKSTVTHMLDYILQSAGMDVLLGGSVRGQATLPLLDKISEQSIVLLELDSWQLQGFHDEKISPNFSVFTNFMEDHLNYYKGLPEYYNDKAAIYRYQQKGDYLVMSESSYQAYRDYDQDFKIESTVAILKPNTLYKDWEVSLPGSHNRLNAAMAYQVARLLDIEEDVIREVLASVPGIPGRLELIESTNNFYYNDTNATIPEATTLSILALANKHNKKINLIAGGVSKGFSNYDNLIKVINNNVKNLVLFPGGIADKIRNELIIDHAELSSMPEAVKYISDKIGDLENEVVLMSPAGSSFGLFRNEYDRGDQFVESVNTLR